MTSIQPSHPTDAQLLAWLDDDNTFAQHINNCPSCQVRSRALQQTETLLQTALFRATCPTPHTLGEYSLGLLTPQEHNTITQHLARCPHCQKELAIQQTFLAAPVPTPKPALSQQIKTMVASLVQDVRAGWSGLSAMQPALAAIRGPSNGPQIYEAGDYQLSLEFIEDPEHMGRRALFGLLLGDDAPDTFEIQLWQQDVLIQHTPVDAYGNFSIDNLPPGAYEMKLIRPKLIIHLNNLTL
jgi:hypothetical protein